MRIARAVARSLAANRRLSSSAGLGAKPFPVPLPPQKRTDHTLARARRPCVEAVHVSSAEEAVACVNSGDRVFVHTAAAVPTPLVEALGARYRELSGVEACHLHVEGRLPYADEPVCSSIRARNFFVGANMRAAVNEGRADAVPIFLSEVPRLFSSGRMPLDVALITVSPPDRHGYCSLGTSVDVSVAAMMAARTVVAQVNRHMPRTHGEGVVHVSQIDFMYESARPLPESSFRAATETDKAIARNVASLIEDGSTLQMGIGALPDQILAQLHDRQRIGIHTEMFSVGVKDLVERGVVDGSEKHIMPHVITASFLMGDQDLYDFVDDCPLIQMRGSDFVNDPHIIRQNPRVVAINSAIEVDLTGQVCADSIGATWFSGIGGQLDFERGAALSEGGKPVIALPSVTSRGESRISAQLKPGAGVTTTRGHAAWICTEYGCVDLVGRSLRERAKLLISIAHPDHREALEREAFEQWGRH